MQLIFGVKVSWLMKEMGVGYRCVWADNAVDSETVFSLTG